MQSSARVVIIGGGVVGVSTLYHLAKKGCTDAVLLERKELTSGSTWHAAGLLPLFNLSYSVGKIHQYSVDLYDRLEAETGQHVGLRKVSNIRLARTEQRMDEYRYYASVAKTINVDVKFLTPDEIVQIWPLCSKEGLVGAIQHPDDGYVQPADLTQALARGARDLGASIHRNTTVTGLEQTATGWKVTTDKGEIDCEHVVSASGNFARQTGAMAGLDVPVIPVEHQYIVTEPHPDIVARQKAGLPEMGVLRESDSSWYMREENGGLLLGPYEKGAPCCYVDGPAANSEYELFEEDLERLEPHIDTAIARVPAFGEVGVKKVYNGAICYTPDGSPIIGPAWDVKNFWFNEGHSFGITAAGGAGWQLAEWIVDGEPTIDMMGVDPRRFGPYAGKGYLREKNEEAYANVFTIHFPNEERPAARPLKQSPSYDRQKALGAVFGQTYGWERANWFAPVDYSVPESELERPDTLLNEYYSAPDSSGRIKERYTFRRSNAHEFVGEECRNVQENVGLLDMSAFAKAEVAGPGARAWLESIFANRIPKKRGAIALCHLLTKHGGVRAEFTVYEHTPGRFYLVSAGAFERHDQDCLKKLLPEDGSVSFNSITGQYGVLVLAGPKSRDMLQPLVNEDLGNESFRWLTGKSLSLGTSAVHALRVNFVGELGWEIHHPIELQNTIYDLLMEAGQPHGIKPFGIRAMDSLRLEKSYRLIPRELSIEYSAYESGLDRFVKMDKEDFIGRQGLEQWQQKGVANQFVTMEVHGADDLDARGSEAVYRDGKMVGRTTSGGYGWRLGKSLALAMVPPSMAGIGEQFQIEILGKMYAATVIEESPYDPTNEKLRA